MMLRPVQQPASVFSPLPRVNSRRLLRTMDGPSCGAVVRLPQPGRWGRSLRPRLCRNYSSPSDGAAFTALRRCLALVWR